MRWAARACVALLCAACKSGGYQLLHEGKSEFNHLVVREEQPGVRTLQFGTDGVIQSRVNVDDPMDLKLVYTRAAMLTWAMVPQPKRLLIIGLGGGAMPTFFHRSLPNTQIEVAELDPGVLDVATKYFGLPRDARLKVAIGDGRAFVQNSDAKWDLVMLDAYGDSEIPRHLATAEFLAEVKAHLAPGAIVGGNVWSREHNSLYDPMARAWADTFGAVCVVGIEGSSNRIFLASNGGEVTAEAIRAAAAKLKAVPWLPSYAPRECLRDGWESSPALHDR